MLVPSERRASRTPAPCQRRASSMPAPRERRADATPVPRQRHANASPVPHQRHASAIPAPRQRQRPVSAHSSSHVVVCQAPLKLIPVKTEEDMDDATSGLEACEKELSLRLDVVRDLKRKLAPSCAEVGATDSYPIDATDATVIDVETAAATGDAGSSTGAAGSSTDAPAGAACADGRSKRHRPSKCRGTVAADVTGGPPHAEASPQGNALRPRHRRRLRPGRRCKERGRKRHRR